MCCPDPHELRRSLEQVAHALPTKDARGSANASQSWTPVVTTPRQLGNHIGTHPRRLVKRQEGSLQDT